MIKLDMTKNNYPKQDWSQRGNVTLPLDKVDYIKEVAREHKMPVYQLVFEAVSLFDHYRRPLPTQRQEPQP